MRLFGFNHQRSETLLLAIGQLVLIAYLFQVAAFDHWEPTVPTGIAGIDGTSEHARLHAEHCHGAASTCADAGSVFAHLAPDQVITLPGQAASLVMAIESAPRPPSSAFVAVTQAPPRLAA